MSALSYGFFSQLQGRPGQTKRDLYAEFLDTVVAAEELGYESVWIGQHHFDQGFGRAGSPWTLLAAAAERTSNIELGTAINVLPFEDPIRLAEDVAAVQEISGGRVHLGVGSGGGDQDAFEAFGVDYGRRREVFDEKLALLERALAGEPLVEGGIPLGEADPSLRDRVWVSPGSPDRAREAARRGHGLLLGTFFDHPRDAQLAKLNAYLEEWRATWPDKEPRTGVQRFTYFGTSRRAIERQVESELNEFRLRRAHSYEPTLVPLSTEQYLRRVARYGTLEDVIDDLNADPALTQDVTHLLVNNSLFPAVGSATAGEDLDIDRLTRFAREVVPNLRIAQAVTV